MKSIATEPIYQSTFIPKIASAETKIKKLIVYYFLNFKPKATLVYLIQSILKDLYKSLPSNTLNKETYINGLSQKANKMINEYYDKQIALFLSNVAVVKQVLYTKGEKLPKLNNPIELQRTLKKYPYSMWEQAKGTPYITNYEREVKKFIKQVAEEPITAEDGISKGISIWQKAELDIRHEKQLEMLDEFINRGVKYAYLSSHPDCSKRCEKWQGKLVSLTETSTMTGFRVKKMDGQWVYSLPDIINQVDKYGYKNNIIVGFNCRHHLIEYNGQKPPKEFSEEDVKKQRTIESKIRQMEREIRTQKNYYSTLKMANPKDAAKLKKLIQSKISQYKKYCESNGYSVELWRLNEY